MGQKLIYDAIHVFGAVMRWVPEHKKWIFPLILDEHEYDGRLVLGDWRAEAAYYLQDAARWILVTGGVNIHPETKAECSRAVELAKEIVKWGVPSEKVQAIGTAGASHTQGNLANLRYYLEARPDLKKIGMLCPRFQMARAMVMLYAEPFFCSGDITSEWIEVEDVLVKAGSMMDHEVDRVYNLPEGEICRRKELKGIKDFLTKKYKPKQSA